MAEPDVVARAEATEYRLPMTVVPSRYDIRLEPDLEAATFAGEEAIAISVVEPVTEIVLNAAELAIQSVAIEDGEGAAMAGQVVLDEAAERARFVFPSPVAAGQWRLRVRFTGALNDRLHGFYRSTYKDTAGVTHTIAATQFESTDARRGFPCWDEPAFKAVFGVTLVVPEGLAAVSNTAIAGEAPVGPGRRAVTFADTIRMSTYLVAFVVGELEATDAVMVGKTPLRVWCVPGKVRLTGVALEIGAFSLDFFERYYGLPYPGDKLDLLAIPDFAAGAMENLGAVTFRETALLVDEAGASHTEIERIADVVAHEVAHMWFGDLVTMAWWNGIWLNEAFATFMELLAVDAWKPEWRRWTSFGVSRAAAMGVDGLVNTRPIEFEVKAPRDCEAMFDLLTYEKGGSVLRMLEQHLGPEVFRDGVRLYLDRHRFGNAETTDLWKALGDAARQPIPEVMDGWIFQPGYPVVSVEPEGAGLRLSQRRFTYLAEGGGDAGARWRIPIIARAWVKRGIVEKHLLLDDAELIVPLPAAADWVVVNAGGHGFYRVRYAPPLLKKLAGVLGRLAPIERFNLVSDCLALAQSGAMPAPDYLDLTSRFTDEMDKNVWAAIIGSFAYVNRIIASELRPGLEALVRHRLAAAVARVGWEPQPAESELDRQLRGDLLRTLGTLGNDASTQERARALYGRHRAGEPVEPNMLPALIAIVAASGDEADYEEFYARFKGARTPQEEQRYLYALAGFRQPDLLRRTLEHTIDGQVRSQDAPFLMRSLLASVYGRGLAWDFLKEHWETMARQYPGSAYRRMYEGVTALVSPEWERDVQDFFASRAITLGGKTLEQYLEQLRVAVSVQARESGTLAAYLGRMRR